MKSFEDVPEPTRRGFLEVVVGGVCFNITALLADAREDGGVYVADEIFDHFGKGDERRGPSNYIKANHSYLSELADVSKCEISNLIGVRKDGRYWCVHQVAVNYAAWLDKKVQIALERAAFAFAKERLLKCFDWMDKRHLGSQNVAIFANVIDEVVEDDPRHKKGAKYGLLNAAAQDPLNKAQGGPEKTAIFKQVHGVEAAMNAYDTPWLNAVNLVRSIAGSNIRRKEIHNVWKARDEVTKIATELAELTKRLLAV